MVSSSHFTEKLMTKEVANDGQCKSYHRKISLKYFGKIQLKFKFIHITQKMKLYRPQTRYGLERIKNKVLSNFY